MSNPMDDSNYQVGIEKEIEDAAATNKELSYLFGENIVEQSRLIDVAQLNLTDEMTANIGTGLNKLKKLKDNPKAQRDWVDEQLPGTQLLLCLWIMDMELLSKIQVHSYFSD